jgi:hypothetical protein
MSNHPEPAEAYQSSTLPWTPAPSLIKTAAPEAPTVRLFNVTAPRGQSLAVVAETGQFAIMAACEPGGEWHKQDIWPDQCQAEVVGATGIADLRAWNHWLVDAGLKFGLVFFQPPV